MGRMTYCLPRNVFDSCVKSQQYFHIVSISLETSVHWLSEEVVRFEIEDGVYEKFAKLVSHFTQNSRQAHMPSSNLLGEANVARMSAV